MPRLLPVPAVDTALAVGLGLVFRATLETVHVLSIIVWIGGMVFAHFFWRPAVAHVRY